MRTLRLGVVLAVVFADLALLLFGRMAWNYSWLFAVLCWTILNVYWTWASRKTPPVAGSGIGWWLIWLFSLMEFVIYCLPLSAVPILGQRLAPRFASVELFGAMLCAAGTGLAIGARHVLAASWNNTPSLREGHALVTHGPYALVRHPIYLGFMLSAAGLILVLLEVRALVLLVDLAVFFRKMKPEEELLRSAYPAEYPDYERRVRRLLPGIW